MAQYLSPGVYVDEIDLSNYVPAVSTSVGAFVGEFEWGPFFEVRTLTSPDSLEDVFGEPDETNYEDWFTAWNFLNYSSTLKIIRACNRATTKCATATGTGLLINSYEDWNEHYSDGSGSASYGTFAARYPGTKGNQLYISLCGPGSAYNGSMWAQANTTEGNAIIMFANGNMTGTRGPANTMADQWRPLQIGDKIRIGTQNNWLEVANISLDGYTVTVNNANLVANGGGAAGVGLLQNCSAQWEYADRFEYAPGTTEMVERFGGSNDEIHLVVVGRLEKFGRGRKPAGALKRPENILERFVGLSVASHNHLSKRSRYYRDRIGKRSKYIHWMGHPSGGTNWGNTGNSTAFTVMSRPYSVSLSGGTYGTPTNGDIIEAYNMFIDKTQHDISLIITGSHPKVVQAKALEIAEARADAVTFISPLKSSVVLRDAPDQAMQSVIDDRNYFRSSSYGFFIDNWKNQYDPYNDKYRWVPLDGDIAGLAARTDDNYDAWWSFAGFNRGQVLGVHKLAWKSDEGMRNIMYPQGINSIVNFINEGPILYGDRTMQIKPSAFDRINVRRLFLTIEKAISRAAKYLLFEFNDAFTRAQFVALIEPYLRDVQGRRGLYDFRVVCDESNNPGEVIDRNEFVGDIYIKPAKSINFLRLNFVAVRTDVAFDEVVGNFGG